MPWGQTYRRLFNPKETFMKKILIATTTLALMCGSAFAQGAMQQDKMKPATTNGSMNNGGSVVEKGATVQGTTTGANGMKQDGMSNGSMSKDGMKNDSMNKGGMTK
jgi:pentapeptide MXKDX repeat protein